MPKRKLSVPSTQKGQADPQSKKPCAGVIAPGDTASGCSASDTSVAMQTMADQVTMILKTLNTSAFPREVCTIVHAYCPSGPVSPVLYQDMPFLWSLPLPPGLPLVSPSGTDGTKSSSIALRTFMACDLIQSQFMQHSNSNKHHEHRFRRNSDGSIILNAFFSQGRYCLLCFGRSSVHYDECPYKKLDPCEWPLTTRASSAGDRFDRYVAVPSSEEVIAEFVRLFWHDPNSRDTFAIIDYVL